MKKRIIFVLLAFLIMGTALPSSAQVCGDLTGDGNITIVDMVRLMEWVFAYGPPSSDILPDLLVGDIDGHYGLTQGDITRMAWYLFGYTEPGPLNCTPTVNYSFSSSSEDTLFVPRFLNVPAEQDVVYMPIFTNLKDDTRAVAIYLQKSGPGFDNLFDVTWIDVNSTGLDIHGRVNGDTLSIGMKRMYESQSVSGPRQVAMITFTRTNPGVGDIELVPVDRSIIWRLSVVKDDYDIQIPTIVTIDFDGNLLQATPTELSFESVYGFPPPAVTQNIDLTDVSGPINWSATVDQDWLNIDVNMGTTPSTIQVSVDPTGLGNGIHNGTVTIVDMDFQYATPIEVPVTLTVVAPFPSMDANCDGHFNISDLTYIVKYLFGNPTGPAPCDPCTGTFPQE